MRASAGVLLDIATIRDSDDEGALALPFDAARSPGGTPRRERLPLELPADDDLVVAFLIGLARWSGQASIPVSLVRAGWTGAVRLPIGEATTARELRDRLAAALHRPSSPLPIVTGDHAVVRWGEGDEPAGDLQLLLGERAALVYDASRLHAASVTRLAGHLAVLRAGLLAEPSTPITRLPILAPEESAWLESVARGAPRTLPAPLVHQLIEARADATPDKTAVRFRDQGLSYAALDARANQLAHHLLGLDLGAARVAVCVEPSFDIAIALLGILKAGATYVPIDPGYPPARIRAILDDTQPALVVTQPHLADRLELGFPLLTLAACEHQPTTRPGKPLADDTPASIYYTSGTTGQPKGVVATHANLRAYLQLSQERYGFHPGEVMPAIARFSFSISMFELASPLVAGGTLVVLERDHVRDPAQLAATLAQVTFFHAGPSLLRVVLPYIARHYSDPSAFDGVRHASSGGDLVAPEIVEQLKAIFRNAEVYVIYGCSEISCMGCTWFVPRDHAVSRTFVGKPFDSVSVRVVDRHLAPVPAGVVGEILFAGPGVTAGYNRKPELTAEKFVVAIDGHRYYRTGDLGRVAADGNVEILGRNDFQVKVRGMRIELGEIEHTLRRAPGVKDAAVAARPSPGGDKALVAYVVLAQPDPATSREVLAEVRRHMTSQLPDYMVPSVYLELAALPLNVNLKLDRHALPAPELFLHERRAPRTPTEKKIAAVWQRVLGVSEVGRDDNFFELGGDSLLTLQLIGALKADLGVTVDGMDVLRESLQVLAALCDGQRGGSEVAPGEARWTTESFFFGEQGGLYGVMHRPREASGGDAVLVVAPLGQERVRAGFVIERLARELAVRGIPSLRFDPYGTGDSLGESVEATCRRWLADVATAAAELRARTGAARIVGVGVRLGATLLATARQRLGVAFDRLVFWDAIDDGKAYRAELEAMHRAYLKEMQDLRFGWPVRKRPGQAELMGTTYSATFLGELSRLGLLPLAASAPSVRWLATTPAQHQERAFHVFAREATDARFATIDLDCGWRSTGQLEELISDTGIARRLADMVRK